MSVEASKNKSFSADPIGWVKDKAGGVFGKVGGKIDEYPVIGVILAVGLLVASFFFLRNTFGSGVMTNWTYSMKFWASSGTNLMTPIMYTAMGIAGVALLGHSLNRWFGHHRWFKRAATVTKIVLGLLAAPMLAGASIWMMSFGIKKTIFFVGAPLAAFSCRLVGSMTIPSMQKIHHHLFEDRTVWVPPKNWLKQCRKKETENGETDSKQVERKHKGTTGTKKRPESPSSFEHPSTPSPGKYEMSREELNRYLGQG